MVDSPLQLGAFLNTRTGELSGERVTESRRTLAGLAGYFLDELARAKVDQELIVYLVQAYEPKPEGEDGAICCATTFLQPGLVGDEFFLTRGHFHANQDRPEMEVTISGEGALVLMSEDRRTWMEPMRTGTVHHVPQGTAHRVANTGAEPLVFVSYWASETGHDYESIRRDGFAGRVMRVNGEPQLILGVR